MKDHTHPTQPVTNPGPSANSPKEPTKEDKEKEDRAKLFQLLEGFEGRIAFASFEKQEFIEADPLIINHFNKRGLGGAEYFLYKGVKVFPIGKAQEIMEKEQIPIAQKLHGKEEGIIEGRTGA